MMFDLGGNKMVQQLDTEGRLGFDKYGQLWAWTKRDEEGCTHGRIIHDMRGRTCYICNKGWELTAESMSDQLTDQEGTKLRYFHGTCHFGFRKLREWNFWADALIEAGYLFNREELDVRYPHSTPWERIDILQALPGRPLSGFHLFVGRRKRVWELRFHGFPNGSPKVDDLHQVFNDVHHTKGWSNGRSDSEEDKGYGPYYYVHAWTREEVVDFATRFRKQIPLNVDRNKIEFA